MKYQVIMNNEKKFDVIDTVLNKGVKFDLAGSKAAAYARYMNEEQAKAEALWVELESK